MGKTRVLFLCTENAARSQMAEAYLGELAPERFEAHSAGLEPAPINPLTIRVMREDGIDLEELGHRPKSLIGEYFEKQVHVGYLITVCSRAESNCPIYPWAGRREFWEIEDPAAFEGTEEERLAKFREVRDVVRAKVRELIAAHPEDSGDAAARER